MILKDFKDFPRIGRLLGIDWGARRIGVAVSDDTQGFVFLRNQLSVKDEATAVSGILSLIESEKVVGVVVGLPLHSDGTSSNTTEMVMKFAENLADKTDLPLIFIDETLTSFEANENLNIRNKKQILDSESARLILENAIAMIKRS